jgi:hypothetical protein
MTHRSDGTFFMAILLLIAAIEKISLATFLKLIKNLFLACYKMTILWPYMAYVTIYGKLIKAKWPY